jgi:hypothetical protein
LVLPAAQGFTFEDPGGWCTTAYFGVSTLAAAAKLRRLDLQLVTWECEHCESFELQALSTLTQLHTLNICIAAPTDGSAGGSSGGSASAGSGSEGPELLLMLPLLKPARKVTISSSMCVVLRNSKVLARAAIPGVLAQGIMLEEPLPCRATNSSSVSDSASGKQQLAAGKEASQDRDAAARDQGQDSGAGSSQAEEQQQYVRAPAHVVISALRELWPNMEVWQYSVMLPTARGPKAVNAELCCQGAERSSMQQQLTEALTSAVAGVVGDGGTSPTSPGGFALW